MVQLIDSTLREGLQSIGFTPDRFIKEAHLKDVQTLGCPIVEVGHPAVSTQVAKDIDHLVTMTPSVELLVHGLIHPSEVERAHNHDVDWIGLFLCIRPELRDLKYGAGYETIRNRLEECVERAHQLGVKVRVSCEDASRTEWAELVEFYHFLQSIGADCMGYSDTTGVLLPRQARSRLQRIRHTFPNTPLFFHGHNDRGMANANALEAACCGFDYVDASVLGLGERVGVASLTEMAILLNEHMGASYQTDVCHELEQRVWSVFDAAQYPHRRFAHKAGLHSVALQQPKAYESIQPVSVGAQTRPILSSFTGRKGVQQIAAYYKMNLTASQAQSISAELKAHPVELTDPHEIRAYLQQICG